MATSVRKVEGSKVVSPAEFLAARKAFLAKEKEFTRLRDDLSRQRRELPREKVEKQYVFEGANGKETLADLSRATLTPYVGQPADVADLVVFLASDESRYITGQLIRIDGGMSVRVS